VPALHPVRRDRLLASLQQRHQRRRHLRAEHTRAVGA
jgi:hypothetical protein